MKTIAIGDTHGRAFWKLIVHIEQPDRVIFIGDYFDTHEQIYPVAQIHNFKEIIEYKKKHLDDVTLLIGNHDHHYFPEVGNTGTSGYQAGAAPNITQVLQENRQYLQMTAVQDNILFSHAGVSETWLDINKYEGLNTAEAVCNFVNELWLYKPKYPFMFNGRESTGDNQCQTPIWIRPRSLMADCQSFKKSMIQVVGHTSQRQIDIEGKATGGRYYFIDTLGTSGEYLIYQDNKFTVNKI